MPGGFCGLYKNTYGARAARGEIKPDARRGHDMKRFAMSKGMTINRAIKHAREKAEELGCTDDGKAQLQLVEWLEELKRWRKLFSAKNLYYLPVIDRRVDACRNDMPTIKDLIKNIGDDEE